MEGKTCNKVPSVNFDMSRAEMPDHHRPDIDEDKVPKEGALARMLSNHEDLFSHELLQDNDIKHLQSKAS